MQKLDIQINGRVHYNLSVAELMEKAVGRGEARIASNGALVAETGKYTGRTPKDKFFVEEPTSKESIDWGEVNQPIPEATFDALYGKVRAYLIDKDVYVTDCYGGAHPAHRISVRFVTEKAWHAMFVKQLLIRPTEDELQSHMADFTIIDVCNFQAVPEVDGTRSEAFILIHLGRKIILIGGTQYAGEMKKAVFTLLNYILPKKGVLSMHCSANEGPDGDTALFFGLSGTGKTSLSADPKRRLIGDDEHGWADDGIFNFEGGCYAKCIRLSEEFEPQIYHAIRYGSVLENVVIDPLTRIPEYDNDSITENTRAAYPIDYIEGAVIPSLGGHPDHIMFLTCDAFGVLPPMSKLSVEQTMYHFLMGYTARVAGTEAGVNEPTTTFSSCFGAPFLPLTPTTYAAMLGERIKKHDSQVWLVNTGWTGGPFGVGSRMNIKYTRAMVDAAISNQLCDVSFHQEPVFGLMVPRECPGVPSKVLMPRVAWSNPAAYDQQAAKVAALFEQRAATLKVPTPTG